MHALIRPKCIYKFCLFHAYTGDFAICFATISYLFQHIWTNLLTQCPSASSCMLLSVHCGLMPIFKVLVKIWKNYIKISVQEDSRSPKITVLVTAVARMF